MDIQLILVFLIFGICILCTVRWFYKKINKKGGTGCGCGCPGCSASKKDPENSDCCCAKQK